MKEDHKHIDYDELAAKYFSGNAADAEVQQLERWVLSSTENKKQFLALQQTWNLAKAKTDAAKINIDQEWASISEKIVAQDEGKGKVVTMKPQRSYTSLLKIAAAAAILVVAGFWIYNNNTNTSLIVSSGSTLKEQQLKDGTQVDLNQFSSIAYEDATDGTRMVELKGDAFFDVARDEEHPFVIRTEEIEVKVLGTSFYVDARDDVDQVQVIVASGTVAMEVGTKKLILEKGEIGTYLKSNEQLSKKQNDDVNYMAWKTNRLVYEEALLEKVIFDLNRTFHKEIELESAFLKDCTLTATYEGHSLDAIIRIIEKTLNLKATIHGERIVLSGSPCD